MKSELTELNGSCIHHQSVIDYLRLLSLATGGLFYQINMGERKQCVYTSVIFCYLLYIATVYLYLILICYFCSQLEWEAKPNNAKGCQEVL